MTRNATSPVAVIGAGIAGLSAARALAGAGIAVHVFDKGRSVAGRTSIRRVADDLGFDHGAQYFTARAEPFKAQVDRWLADGVAAEWQGRLATIECHPDECRRGDDPGQKPRYVGTPGMNAPAKQLAAEVTDLGGQITTGVRVAPLKRAEGVWRLVDEAGASLGDFSKVLVTAPAPQAAELLTPSPALSNAAKSVRMSGCWAGMVAFAEPLKVEFDAAFVNGPLEASPLSWIARDGSKPGRPSEMNDCWVLHGSPAWTEANLEIEPEAAAEALLAGLRKALGAKLSKPRHLAAHLWRYALPENPLEESVLIDRRLNLYAAGDWCGGPKVEGAYLSGLAAAEAISGD